MGRGTKRVVFMGDTHTGAISGLNPAGSLERYRKTHPHLHALNEELTARHRRLANTYGGADVVIHTGDCIDGKGHKSGGTELITTDLLEQCDMAVKVLQMWRPKKMFMVYGTRYHVSSGSGEDMEKVVADKLGADIQDMQFIEVNGVMIQVRHKVGNSRLYPHTQLTAARLSNLLWVDVEGQPKADIYVRGHTHKYVRADMFGWTAFAAPALQAPLTKYGGRECDTPVTWGIIVIDIDSKGRVTQVPWQDTMWTLKSAYPTIHRA